MTEKFQECLAKPAAKNLVREYAEEFTAEERLRAAIRLVANYKTVAAAKRGLEDSWKGQNLHRLLEEVLLRLPAEWTEADRRFFVGKLSEDFQDSDYVQLLEDFVPRYHRIWYRAAFAPRPAGRILSQLESVAEREPKLWMGWAERLLPPPRKADREVVAIRGIAGEGTRRPTLRSIQPKPLRINVFSSP